jgi:hypothetical protein
MAGAGGLPETALSVGGKIGRYFGLVSYLPATLLVFFLLFLAETGAWSGAPQVRSGIQGLGDLSLSDIGVALLLSMIIALLLHPLQFPFTQLLEGYWGTSDIVRRLGVLRVSRYRTRFRALDEQSEEALIELLRSFRGLPPGDVGRRVAEAAVTEDAGVRDEVRRGLDSEAGDNIPRLTLHWKLEQAERAKDGLPVDRSRTMPTRLGNVLRRYEDVAGNRYGIDAVAAAPRLALIAQPQDVAYLEDSREGLDLAVRMCLVSAIATAVSVGALATDGLWLLAALLPYAAAYVSYLGAVAAAHEYGTALCVLVDLDRFALYERLRLPQPSDLVAERMAGRLTSQMLAGSPVDHQQAASMRYVQAPARRPWRIPLR